MKQLSPAYGRYLDALVECLYQAVAEKSDAGEEQLSAMLRQATQAILELRRMVQAAPMWMNAASLDLLREKTTDLLRAVEARVASPELIPAAPVTEPPVVFTAPQAADDPILHAQRPSDDLQCWYCDKPWSQAHARHCPGWR